MTPLVPWTMIGAGLYLTVCGVKNMPPKATFIALLKGQPTPSAPWFVPPNYSVGALGKIADENPGALGQPPSQAAGSAAGGALISATGARGKVVAFAQAQLGEPYVWGASGPNQWDCSGLTMRAYKEVGINLPHHAASQQQKGRSVTKANAQPGDLVFWGSVSGHVAMWLGNNKVIHAPHTGDVVKIATLWDEKHARFRSYL